MDDSWDKLDFSNCKFFIDFALENNLKIRNQALISQEVPYFLELVKAAYDSWPEALKTTSSYYSSLEISMTDYISTTMRNTSPNDVYAWDVVNEVIDKNTVWHGIEDYICKAFNVAKKVSPKTLMFYNDVDHESMVGSMLENSDEVFKLVKENKDCGIDGVGFQSHFSDDMFERYTDEWLEGIRLNMKRYAEIGIEVHIT